jgi:DNA polymerase III delta prime subunit
MIEDLNNKLLNIMNSDKTNLVIFIFSASRELNKTFLSKIFNDSILNNKDAVKIMKMNGITEINIMKTIQKIVHDNGIRIPLQRINDIVKNSNKDMINAIQTLQFYAAGKTGVDLVASQISNVQRLKRK